MNTVRLHHPGIDAYYDAPESAAGVLARSGWVPADSAVPIVTTPPALPPAPQDDPPSPRRVRRGSTEEK
ncbi:hypothetical protein [Actinomadura flavalba]|uniref:hypothetical protein n=1 Tax=Actinomadura flavalba TaxID=1120938 RepID=UPI00039BF81F|nr:hypothetical protein [Actinomadura flavalba]